MEQGGWPRSGPRIHPDGLDRLTFIHNRRLPPASAGLQREKKSDLQRPFDGAFQISL